MCGILGISNKQEINPKQFNDSLDLLNHRGPDHQNTFLLSPKIILGHVRLSILDLDSRSNQPMIKDDLIIVFNGEIFNYIEIRNELRSFGYIFKTSSDTEVVINSYKHWGSKCVEKFNGMWAFCILDKVNNMMFLSRDRFGIKPLKYFYSNDQFIFSSESKSILPLIENKIYPNFEKITSFIKESSGLYAKNTWFEGVNNLLPGQNLEYNIKTHNIITYDYKFNIETSNGKSSFEELLKDSIKLRLRADVKIGFTLSSGIDSSTIVALANKLIKPVCYTAGFNHKDSEHFLAKSYTTLNDLEHYILFDHLFSEKEALSLVYHLESGHASPAIFPLLSVYKKMNKDGVKISIEGQGADELLAGYIEANYIAYLLQLIFKFEFKTLFNVLKTGKDFSTKNSLIRFFRQASPSFLRDLLFGIQNSSLLKRKYFFSKREYRIFNNVKKSWLRKFLDRQYSETLTSLLHYGDSISMMYSIESRLPFMDINIVSNALSRDPLTFFSICNDKLVAKNDLRNISKKHLPDFLLKNKKKGFFTPTSEILNQTWTQNRLKNFKFLKSNQIINNNFNVLSIKNENLKFRLLMAELWFEKYHENLS